MENIKLDRHAIFILTAKIKSIGEKIWNRSSWRSGTHAFLWYGLETRERV